MHRFSRTCALVLTAGFWIAFGACESELPPYKDPSALLQGKVYAAYNLNVSANELSVFMTITNSFDETLQGKAVFDGQFEVTPLRNPSFLRTFSVSDANILHAKNYDPISRILTIDPQDSVTFRIAWNFIAENGVDLRNSLFRYSPDRTCRGRSIAAPEAFSLYGKITVFNRIPAITATLTEFLFCHVDVWVNTKDCPPVLGCPP